MFHVVFVCTGNTCRSPMAEAYFKHISKDLPIKVTSAGVAAFVGGPISDNSGLVMKELGIDASNHRSSPLSSYTMESADLVIGLTRSHVEAITAYFPDMASKVHTLLPNADVSDPIGGSLQDYRACFGIMKTALDNLHDELKGSLLQ